MRVSATDIANWASTREAQGSLPLLVRQLIIATAKTSVLRMPSGDSVAAPGWDGRTLLDSETPWIPKGLALWEMGCNSNPEVKASNDFKKRSAELSEAEKSETCFVFVSPRRWRNREKWLAQASKETVWRQVKVLDADDLEAWIDSAPSVGLWFSEILGLSGPGVESIQRSWDAWRSQSKLALSLAAMFTGRDQAVKQFFKLLDDGGESIILIGDSQEEASAFANACLIESGREGQAVSILHTDGWRYVDANERIIVAIASNLMVAERRILRPGLTSVIPLAKGTASNSPGESPSTILIERPEIRTFENALIALGEEASKARRLANSTGRSWTVYRRTRAKNPAIRKPVWLSDDRIKTLATLTLIGSWNGSKQGDRACVAEISNRQYEEIESDLLGFARVDDSPVIKVGTIWRAKSSLDLLHLCMPLIPLASLERFLSVTEAVLASPDPALELPDDKRWMAAIYGKTREQSGLVIESLSESLAKLSVYCELPTTHDFAALRNGITSMVRRLLHEADSERWLSLSSLLPALAEAAPDFFLLAVETSLKQADAPVRQLVSQSSSGSLHGRCWHAGLLWALECLAWLPSRLIRVTRIIAALSTTPTQSNWGNTPANSLTSFFRSGLPQTLATAKQRLAAIDRLISDDEGVAWLLLLSLVPNGPTMITPNAVPKWRDDDAGARDLHQTYDPWYVSEIRARLIKLATQDAERIAQLLNNLSSFAGKYKENILELVEGAVRFDDKAKEVVRTAVRTHVHWHNEYNSDGASCNRESADRLRPYFDLLAPQDAILRNRWLFENNWLKHPDGNKEDVDANGRLLDGLRAQAMTEIVENSGFEGVMHLANQIENPFFAGFAFAKVAVNVDVLSELLFQRSELKGWTSNDGFLRGLLQGQSEEHRAALFTAFSKLLAGEDISLAAFFANASFESKTWVCLSTLGAAVAQLYWASIAPSYHRLENEEIKYVVGQLKSVQRPRTAFALVRYDLAKIDADVLTALLNEMRAGVEPGGPLPEGWDIEKAIEILRNAGVSQSELAKLEFAYYPALKHSSLGTQSLLAELLSEPMVFMQLVEIVYEPQSQESEPLNEAMRPIAEIALRILHAFRGIPGQEEEYGEINPKKFWAWIGAVRQHASEVDRQSVTDSTIGCWLSACDKSVPKGWPDLVYRLLDQDDAEEIRSGFCTGLMNNRGSTTRWVTEGGNQEIQLVTDYSNHAEAIRFDFPNVADMLDAIAESYRNEAQRADDEAELRREMR